MHVGGQIKSNRFLYLHSEKRGRIAEYCTYVSSKTENLCHTSSAWTLRGLSQSSSSCIGISPIQTTLRVIAIVSAQAERGWNPVTSICGGRNGAPQPQPCPGAADLADSGMVPPVVAPSAPHLLRLESSRKKSTVD